MDLSTYVLKHTQSRTLVHTYMRERERRKREGGRERRTGRLKLNKKPLAWNACPGYFKDLKNVLELIFIL